MEHDRGRSGVADAGGFAGFLDSVVVVAGAFHRSRAGAFGAVGDEQGGDFGEVVGEFGGSGANSVMRISLR